MSPNSQLSLQFQSDFKAPKSTRNTQKMKDILKRVKPDYKEPRIPDTEHLARMRALLVKAHQNDNFIKQLAAGNSYVPANTDPSASRDEMGMSFQDLYVKNNQKIQKNLKKADAKLDRAQVKISEDGILIQEENPMASSSCVTDPSDQDTNSEYAGDAGSNINSDVKSDGALGSTHKEKEKFEDQAADEERLE